MQANGDINETQVQLLDKKQSYSTPTIIPFDMDTFKFNFYFLFILVKIDELIKITKELIYVNISKIIYFMLESIHMKR